LELYTTFWMLKYTKGLVTGLKVPEKTMRKNLELTQRLVVSQGLMLMTLGESIGRSYAHDLVYHLCRWVEVN
jgi:adenylosuccinate lyase